MLQVFRVLSSISGLCAANAASARGISRFRIATLAVSATFRRSILPTRLLYLKYFRVLCCGYRIYWQHFVRWYSEYFECSLYENTLCAQCTRRVKYTSTIDHFVPIFLQQTFRDAKFFSAVFSTAFRCLHQHIGFIYTRSSRTSSRRRTGKTQELKYSVVRNTG